MKRLFIALFLLTIMSCKSQEKEKEVSYDQRAVALNNESIRLKIYGKGDQRDNLIRANQLLDSAIKIDRLYHLAYTNKIQNLLKLEQYDQALNWADSVLVIKPDLAEVLTGKGLIYDKLRDTNKALKSYIAANHIYESRYASDPNINNLKSLAFSYYLSFGKVKASDLIDREEFRFKTRPEELNELIELKNQLKGISRSAFGSIL